MKVKELILKAHLRLSQRITLNDRSTATTFVTKDRYCFGLASEEVERLLKLKVNSYNVADTGLTIWAE